MNQAQRTIQRQQKLQLLARHAHYGKLCKRLTEGEFDEVVAFIEDYGDLDDGAFEMKVLRFGLDLPVKSKNCNVMADLLLACKSTS